MILSGKHLRITEGSDGFRSFNQIMLLYNPFMQGGYILGHEFTLLGHL